MSWTDLEGWALPSEENKSRCLLFKRGQFEEDGICLPYRYYQNRCDEKIPLVVFLHGADAIGEDNESQIALHDVGTVFADESWQKKHPCHILAPQYHSGAHWAQKSVADCLQKLVVRMAEKLLADTGRIYIYGYSAGAIGIFTLLKRYPDFYAAAVPICGSTGRDDLSELAKTPMWLYHAVDDNIVSSGANPLYIWSKSHLGSHNLYQELNKIPWAEIHYTEFAEGQMMRDYGLHPHCTWVLMGRDEACKEWMFSKRREV